MAYVLESKEQIKRLYPLLCPKCGTVIVDRRVPCKCCLYSAETALTPEEAREFTCAGD